MRRSCITVVVALATLLFVSAGSAQQTANTAVPNFIRYSGSLKDAQGTASILSTTVSVAFAIYDQQDGGAPIWQETQNVTPDGTGQYSVLLGSTAATGLPDALFSQQEQRWLGVQVQGQDEQARSLLVSLPYAFKAHEAETLGGLPASAFVQAPAANAAGASSGASQNAGATGNAANTTKSGAGIDTIVNCTNAANGRISVFTGAAPPNITLCNSGIYEAPPYGTGAIGILNANPMAALDVTGATNTSLYYQIGESTVLSIGSAADANLFLGVGAGASNVAGQGQGNTFSGYAAGYGNTSGNLNTFFGSSAGALNTTGYGNTYSGYSAGYSNTTSQQNTFYGAYAGYSNTSYSNTFSGYAAGYGNTSGTWNTFYGWRTGYSNTTGNENTFYGTDAGFYNTTGVSNTFSGTDAGWNNTSGYYNTFYGWKAGSSNTTGHDNTFYGFGAGSNNTTGSSNVYIASVGAPSGNESNTIRIGWQGDGDEQQNTTYIAGIYGTTSSGGIPVYVNSNGQLGTSTSSRRFKEQIADMDDSSNKLFELRPVTFFYKPQYDDGSHLLQYGLIAEEVAKVYPDMVVYDKDSQPYTVKYQLLAPMLLNELQKQHAVVAAQQDVIKTQQGQIQTQGQQIADLQGRLSRLESAVAKE